MQSPGRFLQIIERVRRAFLEDPGLCVGLPELARLVGMSTSGCPAVVAALVNSGFLRWTEQDRVCRADTLQAQLPRRRTA